MKRIDIRWIACATAFGAAFATWGATSPESKWSYAGSSGPARWAKLDKSFATCEEGLAQSPIDIPDAKVRKGDFPSMLFHYQPAPLSVTLEPHTLMVKFPPGSAMTIESGRFDLEELEFRRPGEHKVDDKSHELEALLIHRTKDGKSAILVVPFNRGKENPAIRKILDNVPAVKGKTNTVSSVTINPVELLPDNKDYYAYAGSMDTPPCTENVEWFIFKRSSTLSADQLARLAKLYPPNARPTQAINGRDIRGSR
jgi:carbonic anhydrase